VHVAPGRTVMMAVAVATTIVEINFEVAPALVVTFVNTYVAVVVVAAVDAVVLVV